MPNNQHTPGTNGHLQLDKAAPLCHQLDEAARIKQISHHFSQIMLLLGLDLSDDSLRGTPQRVASMFVRETFSGLYPVNRPSLTLFENSYGYQDMLVEKNITLYSTCEHHFVPIIGKVHVAYYPGRYVIGLSKINRLVQYFARRPQVQERLTVQIATAFKETLQTEDVAVMVDATHLCVSSRGAADVNSSTITAAYSGKFEAQKEKETFLRLVQ